MIENMTAKEPLHISSPTRVTITEPLSGDVSREGRDHSPGHDFESRRLSKRQRSQGQEDGYCEQDINQAGEQCDETSLEGLCYQSASTDVNVTPALSTPATDSLADSSSEERKLRNFSTLNKRRVLDDTPVFDSSDNSIVVPEISESFLSDVNWEPRKYKRSLLV